MSFMSLRQTVDVRIISTETLADNYLHSTVEAMKREGWRLVEQASYRKSRKNPEDVLIYTKWIKDE